MRTRSGYCYPSLAVGNVRENCKRCYPSLAVGNVRENCKRKRQTMSREGMDGERLRRKPGGVNHFDDIPDDVLISVLAKISTSTNDAAEFVNVILTCKRFNTLGLQLVLQEKIYRRLQNLKEMYYPGMKELFIKISMKCQQPTAPDHIDKLRHYKNTLQRMMAYFEVPKSRIPPRFKEDKVDDFEKHIQAILNAFEQRKVASHEQQGW